jgi:hypothetical protein
MTETIPVKVRSKIEMPIFPIPIQYKFGILNQSNRTRKRNKRDSNWERSKTILICRWHDPIPKRPKKLYHKTVRNHKLFWQSTRIQN